MAKVRVTVLVCDCCGKQLGSDDPMEEGGVEIKSLVYHYLSGGTGWKNLFICLECVSEHTLDTILATLMAEDDERR